MRPRHPSPVAHLASATASSGSWRLCWVLSTNPLKTYRLLTNLCGQVTSSLPEKQPQAGFYPTMSTQKTEDRWESPASSRQEAAAFTGKAEAGLGTGQEEVGLGRRGSDTPPQPRSPLEHKSTAVCWLRSQHAEDDMPCGPRPSASQRPQKRRKI